MKLLQKILILEGECYEDSLEGGECPVSAEEFFQLDPEKIGFQYTEEPIEFDGDYIAGSDCDGVDTCWRNYVLATPKYLFVLMFSEKNIKVLNNVVGLRYQLILYVFER